MMTSRLKTEKAFTVCLNSTSAAPLQEEAGKFEGHDGCDQIERRLFAQELIGDLLQLIEVGGEPLSLLQSGLRLLRPA